MNRPLSDPADTDPRWIKSSYSGDHGGNCLEVAEGAHAVWVRDSKNVPGPSLTLPASAWEAFTAYASREA